VVWSGNGTVNSYSYDHCSYGDITLRHLLGNRATHGWLDPQENIIKLCFPYSLLILPLNTTEGVVDTDSSAQVFKFPIHDPSDTS
jgi:hypothetical protein